MLVSVRAEAQTQVETGFERDVNRYRWTGVALISKRFGGWSIDIDNRFTSDAFVLFSDRLSFRDENQLSWRILRDAPGPFGAVVRGRSLWFSQSRVFSQEIYGGVRYAPQPGVTVEPAIGMAWDRRPGVSVAGEPPLRLDMGPAFGMRAAWTPAPINEYRLRFGGSGSYQIINPRRGRGIQLDGAVQRRFDEVRIATDISYSNYRRDAYQAVSFLNRTEPTDRLSETVEATASDTLRVGLETEAPLFRRFRVIGRVDVGANNRFIRTLRAPEDALFFDTAFNRRAVDGRVGLMYGSPDQGNVMFQIAAEAGAEVERRRLTNREDLPTAQASQKTNLLRQADYDDGLFGLHAEGRAAVGRFVLDFNGSSSILRHDTPELNLDDRDELYHTGEFGAQMRLSRYLTAEARLLGTYYHTVYLNSTRSAENNIRRSLRLRPALHWRPSERTRVRVGSEIRATYTVHDFTLPGRRSPDQSARELRYEAALEHGFGGGVTLFGEGSFSDLHLGRLLWDEFAEIPFDTLRTYSGWIGLQVQTRSGLIAMIGARAFIRTDFDRGTTVRYPVVDEMGVVRVDESGQVIRSSITRPGRTWIEQIGPTCSITWPVRGLTTLRIDGWLNVQHVRHRLYGDLPADDAPRIRSAGRSGDRKIIPNVSIVATWRL